MNPKKRIVCLKNMDPFKALLWYLFEGSNLCFFQVQLWAISSSALKLPQGQHHLTFAFIQPPFAPVKWLHREPLRFSQLWVASLKESEGEYWPKVNLGQFTQLLCVTVNGNFCPETKCPILQVKNIWPWLDVTYSNNDLWIQDPRRTDESEIEASLEFLAMSPISSRGIMKSFTSLKRHLMMWNYVSESHTCKAMQFCINWLRDYFRRSQKGEKTKNDGFWTETWKL